MKKVFVASDHAGFSLKSFVVNLLRERGFHVFDLGPEEALRCDYPDYANLLCLRLKNEPDAFGVLLCGTGIGMSISANRYSHIRAAVVSDPHTAGATRAHNNANVLCMGERIIGFGMASSIIDAWCSTEFEGGRHQVRIDKIIS